MPDGSDPWGGCWPGTENTGPDAAEETMTTYAGSCTISTPNVTIDSKVINCSPLIVDAGADGLHITNSYLKGGVVTTAGAAITIEDSQLDNEVWYPAASSGAPAGYYACGDPNNQTVDCGVNGYNFTLRRMEILHTNRAVYCNAPGPCLIEDSYFHGTNLWPDASNLAHASSVRNEQNLTLRHTSLHCSYEGPFPNTELGCSANLSGYPDFVPIKNATIDKNLFVASPGSGFCAYGGATAGKPYSNDPTNATYIKFTDNVFQKGANGKCGAYGAITAFDVNRTGNIWTNNRYDDGSAVKPSL